jgi:hypothetical protein
MTTRPPLTRAELLALPPVIDLPTLARALGVGEWGIRERARRGEPVASGVRVLRAGVQYRVPTEDVLRMLGITRDMDTAGPAPPGPAARSVHNDPRQRNADSDHDSPPG